MRLHDLQQAANCVLTIRPARFGFNVETSASNRYQRDDATLADDAAGRAVAEAECVARALQDAGVEVQMLDDLGHPACPDAVFPNNWVSLHHDGTVVLYPMLARSRRRERRLELVDTLSQRTGRRIERLLDLTGYELHEQFLEGTGSVVFDHCVRRAYACLSPRTHAEPLAELCSELGYESCLFEARDAQGIAVYHTNVLLAVGTQWAVVADAAIENSMRAVVVDSLAATGRHVERIDLQQVARYAGNVLELRAADGATVLALSSSAAEAFGSDALQRLGRCVDRLVTVPIPTIETLGGGSLRCMLAEVFLPR
jgi:hypothetical protein